MEKLNGNHMDKVYVGKDYTLLQLKNDISYLHEYWQEYFDEEFFDVQF